MPVNLSIKNVPDDVVQGLRNRATRNRRSLHAELLDILRQAARNQAPVTIDDLLVGADHSRPDLDETASKVRAAQEAEQERMARRFQDLLGDPDDE